MNRLHRQLKVACDIPQDWDCTIERKEESRLGSWYWCTFSKPFPEPGEFMTCGQLRDFTFGELRHTVFVPRHQPDKALRQV